jgi:hypothetical protein
VEVDVEVSVEVDVEVEWLCWSVDYKTYDI